MSETWAESAAAVPPAPARASDARRFRTYQLARRLIGLAARDGLVLVLDDLHWADASSAGLITHLLRYPVPARCCSCSSTARGRWRPDAVRPTGSRRTRRRGADVT
ncbi:AAA family ATPase [Micromonospora sp. M12]